LTARMARHTCVIVQVIYNRSDHDVSLTSITYGDGLEADVVKSVVERSARLQRLSLTRRCFQAEKASSERRSIISSILPGLFSRQCSSTEKDMQPNSSDGSRTRGPVQVVQLQRGPHVRRDVPVPVVQPLHASRKAALDTVKPSVLQRVMPEAVASILEASSAGPSLLVGGAPSGCCTLAVISEDREAAARDSVVVMNESQTQPCAQLGHCSAEAISSTRSEQTGQIRLGSDRRNDCAEVLNCNEPPWNSQASTSPSNQKSDFEQVEGTSESPRLDVQDGDRLLLCRIPRTERRRAIMTGLLPSLPSFARARMDALATTVHDVGLDARDQFRSSRPEQALVKDKI
jgi:hypothetical protein